ncbi:hypothetical protein D3C80_953020 [compost metagenome]
MGECFVITNLHADLPRMFRGSSKETFLQYRIARAKKRQLAALLQQSRQRFEHQIQPFLASKTANHRKQRDFVVHFESHRHLQLPFVLGLIFDRITAKSRCQQKIGFRVPDFFVHAIQNARQASLTLALTQ